MTLTEVSTVITELRTVHDWWRFAVTRFNQARLAYGHGTTNAADEAAFIILSALELPIDALEPWLACRLTMPERKAISDLIDRRINSRKPASYLTQTAWIQGHRFYVDERVIVPRSFIGELLSAGGLASAVPDPLDVTRVLELCTGSGCLAILAAIAFPEATLDACDLSAGALEVAERNVADYGLQNRIKLVKSDLFQDVPSTPYDLIIANPPYVTDSAVADFPPEYQAEPRMAHAGGIDGLEFVHRILADAPRYLAPHGALIVEIGQARDALETARPDLPFLWLDTETSEGEVFVLQASDFGLNRI